MTTKMIISAIAIAAAMGLSPALAANEKTLNGQIVPDTEALRVQEFCDNLAAAENNADADLVNDDVASANNDNSTDATATGNANASELGAAISSLQIDFDSVTLASCKEGGWIQ